jgi:hypothetical protein
MSKLNKFIISLFTVMFFAGTSAIAGPLSIGISGNFATFDTTGTETETALPADTFTEDPNAGSASSDADFPSLFVEYSTSGGEAGWSTTLGLSYVPGDAEIGSKTRTDTASDANDANDDGGTYTGKAEVSDLLTLYVEPTYMVTDMLGLYGTLGLSQVKVISLEGIALGEDSSSYGNETVYGAMMGVGVRAQMSSGIFMKLSGTSTKFEEVRLQSNTGNKNLIEAKPQMDVIALSVGYNF